MNSLKIPGIKSRDFLFPFLFVLSLSICHDLHGQQQDEIIHYQRKWNSNSIHLVGDKWNPKDLLIPIPASTYQNGRITVHKFTWSGQKGFRYEVVFTKNIIRQVTISAARKRCVEELTHYQFEWESNIHQRLENPVKSVIMYNGRKTILTLTSK